MSLVKVSDKNQLFVETPTIAAGIVTLVHLPNPQKPITIQGYTQTQTPIPMLNEFFVNYASGIISFNAANVGVVNITYFALGEQINAQYINQFVDALSVLQGSIGETVIGAGGITNDAVTPVRIFDYIPPANTMFIALITFAAIRVAGGVPGKKLMAQILFNGCNFPGAEGFTQDMSLVFNNNLDGYTYNPAFVAGHAVLDVTGFAGITQLWVASAQIIKFPVV